MKKSILMAAIEEIRNHKDGHLDNPDMVRYIDGADYFLEAIIDNL